MSNYEQVEANDIKGVKVVMPPNSDPKYYQKLAKISTIVKKHAIINVLAGSVSLPALGIPITILNEQCRKGAGVTCTTRTAT
jgi:hypothetical protein